MSNLIYEILDKDNNNNVILSISINSNVKKMLEYIRDKEKRGSLSNACTIAIIRYYEIITKGENNDTL